MSTIQELFQQAQLAEAAYADFSDPLKTKLQALEDNGSSTAQATELLKNWRVVDQSPPLGNFGNGFSATLFEKLDVNQQPTGQYVLANAGSTLDSLAVDFAIDLFDLPMGGVGYFQVQSMLNYVLRLQAGSAGVTQQVELVDSAPALTGTYVSGIGPGITPDQLTITGHSLGGFLSQIYQRIFGSVGFYTYNAVGVLRPNAPVLDQLTSLLGLPQGNFNSGTGENLLVSLEPAQLIGTIQGNPQITVFSETEGTILAHMMGYLDDSLAVYNLLATIDPGLTLDSITSILKESSNVAANSLESAVSALGKLFNVTSAGGFLANEFDSNRDLLYTALQDIAAALPASSLSLVAVDAATVLNNAKADAGAMPNAYAYRYALVNGNPFAVLGADYSIHNTGGELDLFNTTDHTGSLTNQYLTDRANYLKWQLQANIQDKSVLLGDKGAKNTLYEDLTNHTTLTVNGDVLGFPSSAPAGKIIFGSDTSDDGVLSISPILEGGTEADRLYGMGGNDKLKGNGGNDYLEGGSGHDSYIWNSGDGLDSIRDTDGLGLLVINGQTLTAGESRDGGRTYLLKDSAGNDHACTVLSGDLNTAAGATLLIDNALEVFNCRRGDLGLTLNSETAPQPAPVARTITGDLAPIDYDPATAGIQTRTDDLGNLITDAAKPQPDRADYLYDSAGNDTLSGDFGSNTPTWLWRYEAANDEDIEPRLRYEKWVA